MNPLVMYSMARLALFVLVLGLVTLAGARGLLALGLAVMISMLASYPVLRRQREAAAAHVARKVETRLDKINSTVGAEDQDIEDGQIALAQHDDSAHQGATHHEPAAHDTSHSTDSSGSDGGGSDGGGADGGGSGD